MKKALVFGAGNIGRGFMGQLLSQSGYEVVFLEINGMIVDRLNQERRYPIRFVSNEGSREIHIHNVRALHCRDIDPVAAEFIDGDIVTTSVGVNALDKIAPILAAGLRKRWMYKNMRPLNILICENRIHADEYLYNLVSGHLSREELALLREKVGFVEVSIGRMVPSGLPGAPGGITHNPLEINAEEYEELPVDRDGFKGEIPYIKTMVPFSPFDFYIKRKIFVHNMGHSLVAYLGYLRNHEYIYSAIEDPFIKRIVKNAFDNISRAMAIEYNVDLSLLNAYAADLMKRFDNRALGDTVGRVARDPVRKLAAGDRFVGAARICEKHGILPTSILLGLAAGFLYNEENDSAALAIQKYIGENGIEAAICHFSGLEQKEKLFDTVVSCYNILRNSDSFEEIS